MREFLEALRCVLGAQHNKTKNPVPRIVKHRRFNLLVALLSEESTQHKEKWLSELSRWKGGTALHSVLEYQPPLELVDLLIQQLAEHTSTIVPEEATDDEGQNPLHIAVANGCDSRIAKRLLSGVSGVIPAVGKDSMGRFPLHCACENPTGLSTFSRKRLRLTSAKAIANMVNTVYVLVTAYPLAATIPDNEGHTPLHLALLNKADDRIIRVLRIATNANNPSVSPKAKGVPAAGSNAQTEQSSDCEEIPVAISSRSLEYNDDLSTIGWESMSVAPKKLRARSIGTSQTLPKSIPGDVIVESSDEDEKQVIQRCWFM